jgi:hypothetical protein
MAPFPAHWNAMALALSLLPILVVAATAMRKHPSVKMFLRRPHCNRKILNLNDLLSLSHHTNRCSSLTILSHKNISLG